MFRKLVSHLSFSPALVGQLSFYAKRLKAEEVTRRMGLIFTVLALIVQSLAVFQPPESANASNNSDFVRGGISSLSDFLRHYDNNHNNMREIFNYAGITRAELAAMKPAKINSKQGDLSWGRTARFSRAQGEVKHTIPTSNGSTSAYSRPLALWDSTSYTKQNGSTYDGWVGQSKKMGKIGILKNCANLLTRDVPPPPPPPAPQCPAGQIGTPPNCTVPLQPEAVCSSLSVTQLSRTSVRLTAEAAASDGARIQAYTFQVADNSGNEAYSRTVNSSSLSRNTQAALDQPGNYTAQVTVDTSLGERTDSNCQKRIVIQAPERCPLNPDLTIEDPNCRPCPGDDSLWVKDNQCREQIIETKQASNVSQNEDDASGITAMASDKISYTLSIENVGNLAAEAPIEEQLDDVLEYATIVDAGAGRFDEETKILSWNPVRLEPGAREERTFVVQMASTIPATPQGTSDRTSYDCIMTNTFGNTININVDCPAEKIVEQVVAELPQTGPGLNMALSGIVLAVVTYFYARARQMREEIRLIRHDVNVGTI